MCVITQWNKFHHAKLANHGTPGIWLGYTDDHPTSAYQVFNPKAKKIILTRDLSFLQKSYRDYNKVKNPVLVTMSYEGMDDEEELKMVPVINHDDNDYNVLSYSKSESDNKSE